MELRAACPHVTTVLPPEVIASIIRLCTPFTLAPLSLVNWFFNGEAEPALALSVYHPDSQQHRIRPRQRFRLSKGS
ncbi:hypothetical protein CC1G_14793 [Coprinopsis cinerea okayama7|uniref:F-box domain-containing protein n=1 Tax=Coprinopsis cinerea (strain Okayama-7 / 130 / ATCC MYA-4618 / FGSC 9003) TaxID=240176 RepID=D6RNH4_COPC7|nr:hypothetical protein CC1G_14793 [Coprinopsis cinerea okayama7\|eukprot:XP_002910815.1 hypothetical protein CC1G_14793 [Coprinopsis cinerea okayama7\